MYTCEKHEKPAYYLPSKDIVVHDDETECN